MGQGRCLKPQWLTRIGVVGQSPDTSGNRAFRKGCELTVGVLDLVKDATSLATYLYCGWLGYGFMGTASGLVGHDIPLEPLKEEEDPCTI